MATIIKSNAAGADSEPVIYVFEDVARRRVDQAQQEAATILDQARRRAEELCRGAEQAGYESAAQVAERQLEERLGQKIDSLMPALRQAAAQLADARQDWLRHWEQAAIGLAVKIAERVVRREIKKSPLTTLNLLREALEMAAGTSRIKICLHPADFEALGDQVARLAEEVARAVATQIVPDPTVSRGGCRLETQHGVIDQQIETQLARIADELTAGA